MREVLISIRPKWCELIASGKKTVEVRKTRPKIDTPFKCYIYETKAPQLKYVFTKKDYEGYPWFDDMDENEKNFVKLPQGKGKVIGEFVCDDIENFKEFEYEIDALHRHIKLNACIGYGEIYDYLGFTKCGYGWHISDLVIYDKPKELSEFYRWTDYDDSKNDKRPCNRCEYNQFDYSENHEYCAIDYDGEHCVHLQMKRPPQSWCYVELLKGGAE